MGYIPKRKCVVCGDTIVVPSHSMCEKQSCSYIYQRCVLLYRNRKKIYGKKQTKKS